MDGDFVVGLQVEAVAAVIHKAVLEAQREDFTHLVALDQAVDVAFAAGHVHAGQRSAFTQAAGHDDEVFHGRVLREGESAGIGHHAVDLHVAALLEVGLAGDIEFIVLLERDVGILSVHDAAQVDRDHLEGLVFVFAVQHGTVQEGVGLQAAGLRHQLAHRLHIAAEFIGARLIYGAVDGDAVLIEGIQFGDRHLVAVLHDEGTEVFRIDGADFEVAAVLAHHRHVVGIGAAGEAARIGDQVGQRLAFFHLEAHRPFHLAADLDHAGIGLDHDHVAFFQPDVAFARTVQEEIVDIHLAGHLAVADDGDVAERTGFDHAARQVQHVEHRGERGHHIGTGVVHVTQDIDLDGADLAEAQADVGPSGVAVQAAVDAGEFPFEVLVRFFDGHAAQIEGTEDIHVDAAFRRDLVAQRHLVGAEDVDNHLVARAEPVVLRGGQVLAGREVERLVAEHVTAVNLGALGVFRERGRGQVHFADHGVGAVFRFRGHGLCGGSLLAFVQGLDAFGLRPVHAAGGQLPQHLFLGFALLDAGFHVFQHLDVGHRALGDGHHGGAEDGHQQKYSLQHKRIVIQRSFGSLRGSGFRPARRKMLAAPKTTRRYTRYNTY